MHANVYDNNVYEAQTCAYSILISVATGWWHCGSTPKDELPDPRGFLANGIPSCAIEQANREVQQDDRDLQHASNQASNA